MNSKNYFHSEFVDVFKETVLSIFMRHAEMEEEEFYSEFFDNFYDAKNDFEICDLEHFLNHSGAFIDGQFFSGAEKLVYVPNNEDFVIKIVWDDNLDNFYETQIYQEAKDKHLERFFLPSWGEEEIVFSKEEGVKFTAYFQSKICTSGMDEKRTEHAKSYCGIPPVKYSQSLKHKYHLSNSRAFFCALSKFNFSEEEKLLYFLTSHNINDLHGENWIIQGGQMKILDYSGYPDSCYY